MKKTPKILPTFYKSKGTPIFRDTTALPFAKGGPIEPPRSTPKYPTPTSTASPRIVYVSDYNKFQELNKQYLDSLSTVRGGVYKSIDLNKPKVYTSIPEGKKTPYYPNKPYQFYSPSTSNSILGSVVAASNPHKNVGIDPTHIVSRVNSSGQEEFYMKFQPPQIKPVYKKPIPPKPPIDKTVVKEEILTVPPPPPVPVKDLEPLEKLETLRPELISRNIPKELSLPPQPEVLQYQMPGYMKSYNFPTVGRYTPLAAKAVQKATGYDRNFMEGYYDQEGNYVPGELENAREQNRAPQFQGASSLRDMFAQKAYQQALEETKSFANGGTIHFERSEYGSDAREQYADGGSLECPPGYVNVNGTCVPTGSLERGPVEQDSADFLIKMANSPLFAERYNAMINDTAKPEEIEAYRKSIINNVNNVAFWPLGKEADNTDWPQDADYIGYYGGQGQVETDKFGLSQLPEDLNNPNRFNVGEQEHVMFRNTASPTMTNHEFSHASTLGDRLPATVKIPFSKDPAKKEYVKFFSQDDFSSQTENKAYLDETRKYLYDKGIYDPTIKAFDETDYDNLIKTRDDLKLQLQQDPENQELKLLMDSFNKNTLPYDKPATIKLFNSYVQNAPAQNQGVDNLAMGMSNQMDEGGPIYTYSKRPGSYYQRGTDGAWMINNSSTGGKYVPIEDPTGQRAALLNKYAKPQPGINKIYADPLSRNSETTQGVAAKTVPQSAGERANVEGARKDIAQRKSNLEKVLITQGKTPEQAASIVGSYGSDWTALETDNARALDTMARRAETIQSGNTPDKMSEYVPRPEQSAAGFAKDVLFNPFTAAGYAIRGQEIPDYMGEKIDNGTLGYYSNGQFVEGRNTLDTVTDIATPIGWAHSAYNIGDKATNNKSGDFWTEENAWDALNVLPGIGLAAKGMKYVPLANRVKFAPKSTASNLAVDAGSIARESSYAPQRPNLLHLGISPEQQELLNLQQVNNTTMLSSVPFSRKLKLYGEDYKSPEGLPSYMNPYLYSQEEVAGRTSEYQKALMKMGEVEKAADRVIKRTTDDKVYYDTKGNIIKTPKDNLAKGGFLNQYLFGGKLNKNC